MRQLVNEGLDLAQQMAALPFKAARQALRETELNSRPLGEVVEESLKLGEGVAKLPFKATAALLTELSLKMPNLEERVAHLERHLGLVERPFDPGL